MADIQFTQSYITAEDIEHTPRLGWIFQLGREDFLYSGSIRIDDGFVRDADGNITSSYSLVRFYAFEDPDLTDVNEGIDHGEFGLQPVTMLFQGGSVSIGGYRVSSILFTTTPGSFQQWIDGKVSIVTSSALGALTAFAFWDDANGQEDPYYFYVESATDLFSGNVGGGWVRHNAIFVPHRRAKYLAVGAKVFNLPNTGAYRAHHFKKWMVEKASPEDTKPTPTYKKAREVQIRVRPDRINLSPNPGAEEDDSTWISTATGTRSRDTVNFHSGLASIAYTSVSGGTMEGRYSNTAIPVKVGSPYSARALLRPQTNPRSVRLRFRWYASDGTTMVSESPYSEVTEKNQDWTEAVVENATAPPGAVTATLLFSFLNTSTGEVHNIDEVIIERGRTVGAYFDGSSSADTLWETGGTLGKARSYLYKNRAARYAAIKRVLDDNVPLGIGIAEPEFATFPADW